MSEPALSQAEEMIRRVSPEGRARVRRERQRRQREMLRLLGRFALAALVIAVLAWGASLIVGPLGPKAIMAAFFALLAVCFAIAFVSRAPAPTPQVLATTDLPQLPQRTEAWLEQQRPTLPAPAARLIDDIALKLQALAPHLAKLDPAKPAAQAVRKLLASELPELIEGYGRVPAPFRAAPRDDGESPDTQLVRGLGVIDGEIARFTEGLAAGAFDILAIQNRYLEIKYKGDDGLGA